MFLMNRLKHLVFVSKNFDIFFQYKRMESRNYKNENIERKYLNCIEMIDRVVKIKREIEDMVRFEE